MIRSGGDEEDILRRFRRRRGRTSAEGVVAIAVVEVRKGRDGY